MNIVDPIKALTVPQILEQEDIGTDDLLRALRNLVFHTEACLSKDVTDMQRRLTRMSITRALEIIEKVDDRAS